jgi:hypothetical protein
MSQENHKPKWLEELQQRSWEPEILLSGIVLFGMLRMPELLDKGLLFFKSFVFGQTQDIDNTVSVLKVAIYWLVSGLILHLIARGIWVGMVGLSYTFDQGIDTDNLKYQGKFRAKVERIPRFQKIIVNLEKICSSLFSVSFMLFMIMIGAYIYLFVLLIVPYLVLSFLVNGTGIIDSWGYSAYVMIVLNIGLIGTIDFVTMGFFRRFRWIAKIYWPIHKLISMLTLSRFYRGIYYGLVSNVNKWYIFLFFSAFIASNFVAFDTVDEGSYPWEGVSRIKYWHNRAGVSSFSGYYDDQNSELPSIRASIQSDVITDNTIRLFIVADIAREDSITAFAKRDPLKSSLDSLNSSERSQKIIQTFYRIFMDEDLMIDYPLKFHYKSHTGQFGYLIYLDITDLSTGLHTIRVKGPSSMYKDRTFTSIPFFREKRTYPDIEIQSGEKQSGRNELKSVKPLIIN